MTVNLEGVEALLADRPIVTIQSSVVRDLIAELRQERERADNFREGVRVFGERIRDMGIALSRAEDLIERVRLYCENQGDKFRYHAGRILDAITEHDKQKGADRG